MFKITNNNTGEEKGFNTKKEAAEYIKSESGTENSVETVVKKIVAGTEIYDNFKVEEGDVLTMEDAKTFEFEGEDKVTVELKTEDAEVTVEDKQQDAANQVAETYSEKNEQADQTEQQSDGRRRNGIMVEMYLNDEDEPSEVYPSIQKAARELKELLERPTMPYAIIHNSIRDGKDYEHTDGTKYAFRFSNQDDKKEHYATRPTSGGNGQRQGKQVIWFEDGEEKDTFPSIKALAEAMKEHMNLQHVPYSKINNALKKGEAWNTHTFKFADESEQQAQTSEQQEVQTEEQGA